MALLGAFAYLPFYFQYIKGDSAIISGLKIFPMVIGTTLCSVSSGIYISKTGKFIMFPTLGTAIFSLGSGLLMLMDVESSYAVGWIYLFIIGCGMGTTFPVFASIVQNSVPPKDMAPSVSAIQFVRSIGGSIGVAILQNVLINVDTQKLKSGVDSPHAYVDGLHAVFLGGTCASLVAFIFAFAIKNNTAMFKREAKETNTTTNGELTKPTEEHAIVMEGI